MWSVWRRLRLASSARRMLRAESLLSLGRSVMAPYSLVARTVFSRRSPPLANQRPRISSVQPRCSVPPYTLAVSKKLIPASWAESMMEWASASWVCGPKFMVPRHRRETDRPERPRWVYFMVWVLFTASVLLVGTVGALLAGRSCRCCVDVRGCRPRTGRRQYACLLYTSPSPRDRT